MCHVNYQVCHHSIENITMLGVIRKLKCVEVCLTKMYWFKSYFVSIKLPYRLCNGKLHVYTCNTYYVCIYEYYLAKWLAITCNNY